MNTMNPDNRDERVLILAPVGRDASMTAQYLHEMGLPGHICADTNHLRREMAAGCGVVLLTEEAISWDSLRDLSDILPHQPAWSDVPLIVLIQGGGDNPENTSLLRALGEIGNVSLIERPVRQSTLLSTIHSALRARRRQYEVRDHLLAEARAHEALGQSEERFRIALSAAELGTWQLDLNTNEFHCTSTCKAFFDVAPEADFSYALMRQHVHPDDRATMQAAVQEAIDTNSVYRCEYRIVLPDGSLKWILSSGRANYDAQGKPYQIVGVMLDITDRKNVEQERERLFAQEQFARAKAEQASRIKDEFLATISHELRTPLTAVLGWTHLLRSGPIDETTTQHALEVIERNARSQSQLIEDLLDISRIISGKMRLEFQPVDLSQVVEAALDVVRPAAQAKQIQLESQLDAEVGSVSGDAARLQQVVWNLLTNAVKFTPDGGQVQVLVERVETQARITVKDSGQGIDFQFLPDVFDRFRQADQTSTRTYGGLGLGLSIVRQIVELHGGTVQAHSEGAGQGSSFVVRLPLARPQAVASEINDAIRNDAANETAEDDFDTSHRLKACRVLVVEDEHDTREFLRLVLERSGMEVTTAGSTAEALQLFQSSRPDVLVSDIGMPGENGYMLIEKIRAWEKTHGGCVPAIALTAYASEIDKNRALDTGFQSHLSKPINPGVLTRLIGTLAGT